MPDEREIQRLESSIPGLARTAFQKAYTESLGAGAATVVRRGDSIIRIFPDGAEEIVKPARPLVRVRRGLKVRLR